MDNRERNLVHTAGQYPASVPAAAPDSKVDGMGSEWDFEAIGEVMDRILAGQRELTPDEQRNLRGIYNKLYKKVGAAASAPDLKERVREWRESAAFWRKDKRPNAIIVSKAIAKCADELEDALAAKGHGGSLDKAIARYASLPPTDNLSVAFVLEDLRAVREGTYDPHLR